MGRREHIRVAARSGERIASDVLAVEYRHAQSATNAAYRHDFERTGAVMYGLDDGSILIKHPGGRHLWAHFDVEDDE